MCYHLIFFSIALAKLVVRTGHCSLYTFIFKNIHNYNSQCDKEYILFVPISKKCLNQKLSKINNHNIN